MTSKEELFLNVPDNPYFKRNIVIIADDIENLVIKYKGKEYSVSMEKALSLIFEERKEK